MLKFLSRNILLYAVIGLILWVGVDWHKCFNQRARYLLGIVYNGFFQNPSDAAVYEDYLKKHGTDHESFKKTL